MASIEGEPSVLGRLADTRTRALLPVVAAAALAFRQLLAPDPATYGPTDVDATEGFFFSPTGGSPVLVYVLAAWFAARRLPLLQRGFARPGRPFSGIVGCGLAATGVLWAHLASADQLLVPSLAVFLLAGGHLLGGADGLRAMAMPAVFLTLLATPIPTPLLNEILLPLQLFTARVATGILDAFGGTVQQSGVFIMTRHATFYVIETCAGLRAVHTLVLTAFVYAEVFHRSRGRLVVLVLIGAGIGLVVNLARVVSLVVLGGAADQPAHTLQGIVMLVGGVLLLAGCDALLERGRRGPDVVVRSSDHRAGEPGAIPVARIAALSIGLLALAAATAWMAPWEPTRLADGSVHDVPRRLGDWTMAGPALAGDEKFMGSTQFSERTWRRYEKGEDSVELYFGVNDRLRRYRAVRSPKTEIVKAGWSASERRTGQPESYDEPITELVVVGPQGARELVHHWYENVGGLWSETWRNALALDRSPWRRTEPARVLRLSTPLGAGPDAVARARRTLIDFHAALAPALEAIRADTGSARRAGHAGPRLAGGAPAQPRY